MGVTQTLSSRTRKNSRNYGSHIETILSYQKNLKIDNTEKIVGNFYSKSHYTLHYQNLKQYLSLGIKLTAVHGGISFN